MEYIEYIEYIIDKPESGCYNTSALRENEKD